jgi:hypothetical protein
MAAFQVVAAPDDETSAGHRLPAGPPAASDDHGGAGFRVGQQPGLDASKRLGRLRRLEGRRVTVALEDGTHLDDCLLVSAGRNRARSLWLVANGSDTFVAADAVAEISDAVPVQPQVT